MGQGHELEQVAEIAYRYSLYYVACRFQVCYGIFKENGLYILHYAINTVSFMNGAKYVYNEDKVHQQEEWCLTSIVYDVTGKQGANSFEWDLLDYS